MKASTLGRLTAWVMRACALLGLVLLCLFDGHEAEARLHPYHVVRSGSGSQGVARIVVIVDSSGSMAAAADGSGDCPFAECEDMNSPAQSKIAAARAAVRAIAAATEGVAEFGFLGFTRPDPPDQPNRVPSKCPDGNRFRWVTSATSVQGSGASQPTDLGDGGVWELCGAQRPFPYLRHDDVGMPQEDAGPIPPSPMNPNLAAPTNASRRVQWFPRYYGPRVHPDADLAQNTYGDFASGQVSGRDFYYWPYVDGFPGYTDHLGDAGGRLGVAAGVVQGQDDESLQLYGPLYIDVDPSLLNPNYEGPASADEARAELLSSVSPLTEGGIDVAGGEINWAWSIGPLPEAPLNQYAIFSSTSIARYMRFLTLALEAADEACGPLAVILVTDGKDGTSGMANYRLAEIAKNLGVGTYVIAVGDTVPQGLNDLACAGSGACDGPSNGCMTPCDDSSALEFGTCADPQNPAAACAWHATSADQLASMFNAIVSQILDANVQTGQGATVNDYGMSSGGSGDDLQAVQTRFSAYTEVPAWRGHVVRDYCSDRDPEDPEQLAEHCIPPNPEFEPEQVQPTFGPCPQSRSWDAGECLQQTAWNERRLFSHDENNQVFPIADTDGSATSEFKALLGSMGLLTSDDHDAEADAIVAFVLGRDAPKGWKLPGLANSSPIVVRRIPEYRDDQVPEVAIRDPHCGGRFYPAVSQGDLPQTLEDFAKGVWDVEDPDAYIPFPQPHHAYQEAVLIGDDMGVLHAFQLESGNELWGFLPRFVLGNLKQQVEIGAETMGQPPEIENHIFGISATLNHAWVHDPVGERWRHVGVFGFGAGGPEYVALELSHMSPSSTQGPFEILWTSEDPALKASYDAYNGETWARPAITYWVPNDDLGFEPEAYLVMGSGYQVGNAPPVQQGRTLVWANVLDGSIVQSAVLPDVSHQVYEQDFGAVVDPAVGSHCLSRFWAEAQETYISDPAGRLFRWDLGRETNHEADSGGPWNGAAKPVQVGGLDHFPACTGTGATCTVAPNNPGDVFVFPAAVSANDRIDDASTMGNDPEGRDQFLVALVSGSSYEDTIDGFVNGLDFHSSLYLLVDDHEQDKEGGFSIPDGAPKSVGAAGTGTDLDEGESGYMRLALSDIERTRTVIPYDGADPIIETRTFSRQTRPVRAPRIVVTGVVDPAGKDGEPLVIEGIEVYFVEFTVYEPPPNKCNPGFYDPDTETWHKDHGSTYIITFRLTADAAGGFDFVTGTGNESVDFGAGFTRGLALESVQQVAGDDCPSGNCGAQSAAGGIGTSPCTRMDANPGEDYAPFAIPLRHSQLPGFTPIE